MTPATIPAGKRSTPLTLRRLKAMEGAVSAMLAGEVGEAEVARIMALSDEEVLAEANVGDVAWARGFKQGLAMGNKVTSPPPAAAAVPEGYVLVPVEPTEAMRLAGMSAPVTHPSADNTLDRHERITAAIWSAMLSARPHAAEGAGS